MPVSSTPADRRLDAFRPIRLKKAADAVVAVLADAIRGGIYEPGDLLPRERDLAAKLQVSRTVVREAIAVLCREGILSVKRGPSGGTTVVSTNGLREVVAGLRGETHTLMLQTLEVRRPLEVTAFLLAAERARDDELDALEPLVLGLERLLREPEEFYGLDLQFHREVVRLSGNPLLAQCYRAMLDQLLEIRQQFPVLRVDPDEALANQRSLYRALRSRDRARITASVADHLAATEVVYLGNPVDGPKLG